MTLSSINLIQSSDAHVAKIRVIGVGGCGGNLVNYMSARPTSGVSFVAVNTDAQALSSMNERVQPVQIGMGNTKGLGAGGDPEVARAAAEGDSERLSELLAGMDMVFIVAGMGKGTGTGASPVVADLAQKARTLTVSLAVMPFDFERRKERAEKGLRQLSEVSDSIIVAPNERLKAALGERVKMKDAYVAANDLLYNAVCGISDIINKPGMNNVDFNDVRAAMAGKGKAVIGSAVASGNGRAAAAAEAALQSELMESVDLAGASHVLVNLSGEVYMEEMQDVVRVLDERMPDLRGNITHGLLEDENMGEELRVTLVVTGVSEARRGAVITAHGGGAVFGREGLFDSGRPEGMAKVAAGGGGGHPTPSVLRRQTN